MFTYVWKQIHIALVANRVFYKENPGRKLQHLPPHGLLCYKKKKNKKQTRLKVSPKVDQSDIFILAFKNWLKEILDFYMLTLVVRYSQKIRYLKQP